MEKGKLPIISIAIPTFNEERNIKDCLDSVFSQDYPQDRLEVMVIDDDSTDRTLEIAKKFPVKILRNGRHHGEIGKMIGFKNATGQYFMYLDADCEFLNRKSLYRLLVPHLENKDIMGSFTRYHNNQRSTPLERYYNLDPLQRDGVYLRFSPSFQFIKKEKKNDYFILEYSENRILPAGLNLYNVEKLRPLIEDYEYFWELDFLILCIRNGFNKFAYVPQAGICHHLSGSIKQLIKKRLYNLRNVHLRKDREILYKWFDLRKGKDIIKIIVWLIYANLFFPSLFSGIYKSIRNKTFVGLYEPVINILLSDIIAISFVYYSLKKKLL